jgi:outer membrane protein
MKNTAKFVTATILCLTSYGVSAQSAGAWLVRMGATKISPQVTSDNMTAPSFYNIGTNIGTRTDVGGDTQLSGGLTYMYTDHFSVDVPIALPFKHKLYGDGAIAGAGQIGGAKALPFTVFGQYRFNQATSVFRPYVGLGLTYAYFFDESGSGSLTAMTNPGGAATTLSVESKFALTPQLGFTYVVTEKWMLDASFSKTYLKTRTSLSTGQTIDTRLNPNVFSLGLGMKF